MTPQLLSRTEDGRTLLSVNAVARHTGIPYSALNRLITENTGMVASWLGLEGSPPMIPQDRVPVLDAWGKRRGSDSRLKPASMAQSLADGVDMDALLLGGVPAEAIHRSPETDNPVSGELARAEKPSFELSPRVQDALERIGIVMAEHVASLALPAPEDRLIGAEAVRELLGGSIPKALQPVVKSPARWKRSQVLRYIASL